MHPGAEGLLSWVECVLPYEEATRQVDVARSCRTAASQGLNPYEAQTVLEPAIAVVNAAWGCVANYRDLEVKSISIRTAVAKQATSMLEKLQAQHETGEVGMQAFEKRTAITDT